MVPVLRIHSGIGAVIGCTWDLTWRTTGIDPALRLRSPRKSGVHHVAMPREGTEGGDVMLVSVARNLHLGGCIDSGLARGEIGENSQIEDTWKPEPD